MTYQRLAAALLICGWVGLLGCEKEPPLPPVPPSTTTTLPPPPVLATGEAAETPAIRPPHSGRLLEMADRRGYVEWLADVGRLYLLDPAGAPLKGAESMVLTVLGPNGPEQTPLTACADADFAGACWTSPAGQLKKADTSALVRFQIGGRPVRVVLIAPPQPLPTIEDSLNTLNQTRTGP